MAAREYLPSVQKGILSRAVPLVWLRMFGHPGAEKPSDLALDVQAAYGSRSKGGSGHEQASKAASGPISGQRPI